MYDLTIITINFNNSNGLNETINSVINQTYSEFEYIVIDGNSTDDSKEVILEYFDKINFWISESDKGIYNAMNKGFYNAKGNYVLFLNSGDTFFSSDSLSSFKSFLKNKEFDIVYGDLSVNGDNKWIKKYPSKLTFQHFIEDSLPFPCTIIKKKVIEEMGFFDENYKIVSDWKFFLQAICKFNKTYFHIPSTIVDFKLDGISSNNLELVKKEREEILKNEFSFLLEEYLECLVFKRKIFDLRKSKKIILLQKLRLLNEF